MGSVPVSGQSLENPGEVDDLENSLFTNRREFQLSFWELSGQGQRLSL